MYEGGVRAAAFATWDGRIPAGGTCREPLHIVDWYPTLIGLCGASSTQPLPVDGRDIWPTLSAGQPAPDRPILLNTAPRTGAVRVGHWKLVTKEGEDDPDGGPPRRAARTIELFNLESDPYEQTNLADTQPAKVAELQAILDDFARQAVPPKSAPKPHGFEAPAIWGE
jgi:arylsulfatase A-like enzyme